jgi:hypothetical protein
MGLIGFHTGSGGNTTGLKDHIQTLDAAGIPCAIVAGDVILSGTYSQNIYCYCFEDSIKYDNSN